MKASLALDFAHGIVKHQLKYFEDKRSSEIKIVHNITLEKFLT